MATCIYRKPYGKTFTFQYESGETVRNASLKRWVKSLAIPLAWQEVEINTDRNAKVLATGRDGLPRFLDEDDALTMGETLFFFAAHDGEA